MNNTSTRTEILEALDNVENVTMESSLDVMFTMADSYDKAAVILENYNGSDLSAFSIFQEDGEGENKTAVQQGDASGDVNAEAKKQNIFVKIWNFIKSVFKSIGDWIKKCWNGFSFPEITKGSDETNKLLDAADGKDEAKWVTFLKQNLGVDVTEALVAGGLTTAAFSVLTGIAFDSPLAAVVGALAGLGLTAGGVKIWLKIRSNSVVTNIKVVAINQLIKTVVSLLGIAAAGGLTVVGMKKFLEDTEKLRSDPELKGIVSDNPDGEEVSFEQIFDTTKTIIDEVNKIPKTTLDEAVKKGENISDDEIADSKKVAKKVSLLGKLVIAIQNLFKKMCSGLNKINIFKKKVDEAESTETPETPATENPDNKDVETSGAANAAAEDKSVEGEGEEDKTVPKIPDEPKVDTESAKTEVDEDDTTVSEAATWYNRF